MSVKKFVYENKKVNGFYIMRLNNLQSNIIPTCNASVTNSDYSKFAQLSNLVALGFLKITLVVLSPKGDFSFPLFPVDIPISTSL